MVLEFYTSALHLLAHLDTAQGFELLHALVGKIQENERKYLKLSHRQETDDVELSNRLQVYRYFSASCLSFVRAIEHVTLNQEEKKFLKEQISHLF